MLSPVCRTCHPCCPPAAAGCRPACRPEPPGTLGTGCPGPGRTPAPRAPLVPSQPVVWPVHLSVSCGLGHEGRVWLPWAAGGGASRGGGRSAPLQEPWASAPWLPVCPRLVSVVSAGGGPGPPLGPGAHGPGCVGCWSVCVCTRGPHGWAAAEPCRRLPRLDVGPLGTETEPVWGPGPMRAGQGGVGTAPSSWLSRQPPRPPAQRLGLGAQGSPAGHSAPHSAH